ncbi:hypothetical protein EYF80_026697 [Liparis tanakae]|uniref:Uncharacterized protein n=1 Tax=Liparis tanakae TaxID=230148 RepID=A0A4Z2HBS8_9TELE|nr:hypothetical protein EYF80_026697 [Liparis tanakae]
MPARKMRSATKRQMHRCRWMVVRVPCMERQNLNVRMQRTRHTRETASPILVTTWSPKSAMSTAKLLRCLHEHTVCVALEHS